MLLICGASLRHVSSGKGEMLKRIFSGLLLILLLIGMLTLALNIQPVKSDYTWTQTIYINADGSIDPPTAPISSVDNVTYTLTDNIAGNVQLGAVAIIVQRNNTIIDGTGHTLQGSYGSDSYGIGFCEVYGGPRPPISNVTIKNMEITAFTYGIWLISSTNSSISGNYVTNNGYGIYLGSSSNNSISGNNIAYNHNDGISLSSSSNNSVTGNNIEQGAHDFVSIWLDSSSNNSVTGNTITGGHEVGISFDSSSSNNSVSGNNMASNGFFGISLGSSNNNVSGNNITNDWFGIELNYPSNSVSGNNITNNRGGIVIASSNNTIYHNNFIHNTNKVSPSNSTNVWDDGYPSGGNYWSDYNGTDVLRGMYQNETGSDGIGDTHYVIDANNTDYFPLMNPYPTYDVAVAGAIAAPICVCQGYGCLLEVNLASKGDYAETFNVIVYANMTGIGNVTVIRIFENVTLQSRDSTMLTFMWDTTGFDLGNYVISAYASPVAGETNIADNVLASNAIQIIAGITGSGGGKMPYLT
jgi:parallel beta-helix repeat protein